MANRKDSTLSTDENPKRLGLRPEEFAARTGLGRSTVFELIRKGEIQTITFGKRAKVIPAAEVERLLNIR